MVVPRQRGSGDPRSHEAGEAWCQASGTSVVGGIPLLGDTSRLNEALVILLMSDVSGEPGAETTIEVSCFEPQFVKQSGRRMSPLSDLAVDDEGALHSFH